MRSGFGLLQSPSGLLLVSNHIIYEVNVKCFMSGREGKTVCSGSCRSQAVISLLIERVCRK